MKKVIIIGGGLAGLSAAVHLSKNKFKVTLLEATPKLGGRAYSFFDEKTNTEIDNGQHILMGCYTDTINFLKIINAYKFLNIQKNLEINYLSRNKSHFRLKTTDISYPFNLLFGLLSFKELNLKEKISLLKFFIKINFTDSEKLYGMTVQEWLKKEKQSDKAIRIFWEIISIGALNTSTEKASAKIFCDILKEIFWKDKFSSKIIIPALPLSKTLCEPASDFIKSNDGEIRLSEKCIEFVVDKNRIEKVITDKNVYEDFDFVVSAVPFYALEKIIDTSFLDKQPEFHYSSILNIHLRIKENFLQEDFYAFYDSELHWLFNKRTHWNIVISNADKFMQMNNEEIFNLVFTELKKFIAISDDDILLYKIIKEKRATFIPDDFTLKHRPSTETKVKNLFIAGDWVDTKLPATIESAVRSGRIAAEKIVFNN
ncbi:MAG: hydroxysqualene dehydroxylase HpnE [Ignavibacterium album]|uniref:hydroxysqualene dehydroxylase HpnE n=1 Tax=Ignavibacterium album TaxID=591197 RepID=UPI0026F21C20|nr:hydroxysqualene dehydroxylase HpnE [Ignavibacterium album]MCX8104560.1 hydroxysqualene dehydroxylase HpnE [Ignavibacterium album]